TMTSNGMAAVSLKDKTILIVDDMRTVRLKLKKICSEMGIVSVYEAGDGAEALQMLQGLKVDLILSDWNMPNMTGIQLVEKMREIENLHNTPVIFITSENEKTAILKSVMLGFAGYVVKPFADQIVREKIVSVLKD